MTVSKAIEVRTSISALTTIVLAFTFGSLAFAQAATVPQMGPGSSGPNVSALQTFLAADASIYPEGLITGYYGALTTAAVQRYQCKNGIVCQGSPATTGYGRVGPATSAKIELQGGFMGGTAGVDLSAPIISPAFVSTTSTSATIHWTTNEPATGSVLYSTFAPSLSAESFAAMNVVADPSRDTSGDVTLSGLTPNTRYYYVLRSQDTSGNLQYSILGLAAPFVTHQ